MEMQSENPFGFKTVNPASFSARPTDPMSSITAGSSEAFKMLNRTTTGDSPEMELAKKRTDASVEMVGLLGKISEALGGSTNQNMVDIL